MLVKSFDGKEKTFYNRDVEYFIANLPSQSGTHVSNTWTIIEIGPDLKIPKLAVPGLSLAQLDDVKNTRQNTLYSIFGSINFYTPSDLKITLQDYIDFVQAKKISHKGSYKI